MHVNKFMSGELAAFRLNDRLTVCREALLPKTLFSLNFDADPPVNIQKAIENGH